MHGDEEDLEAAGEEAEHARPQELCAAASLSACATDCCSRLLAAAGAPACRGDANASDSGMMRSTTAAKMTSVSCQPTPPMRATASGENRNCPNEPAAVPAPKASERPGGGISSPNAPITVVREEPASPNPIPPPAGRWSIPGVAA